MDLRKPVLPVRSPLLLFIFLYLAFSLLTFRHYGCTWDEEDAYQGGAATFGYLMEGVLPSYFEPDHAYPYPFLLGFINQGGNYELLHLLNLLFAGVLFTGLYEVLYRQCGRPWLSLAGPIFLFFTPQFLGNIPANPKDIPFAVFYFLSLTVIFLGGSERTRWVLLGGLFGFTMATRILGFTLLPLMLFYDLFLLHLAKRKGAWKELVPHWAGTLVLSQFFLAVLWPFVGRDYFGNLPKVLEASAKFPPKFEFLFAGEMVSSTTYPWHYLPVMVGITTPLFLLVLGASSILLVRVWRSNRLFVLMGSALLLNFLLYLVLRPALYDGMRHYLFLLPILAVLAALAFVEFFPRRGFPMTRKALGLFAALGIGASAFQMMKLHPYEYLYYNEVVGGAKGAYGRYETDYWAAGMREAVEWLKKNEIKDPRRTYLVRAHGKPFQSEDGFLPNMKRVKEGEAADYSLVMTRAGIRPKLEEMDKVIHRVQRDGVPLVFILRLKTD